MKRQTKCLSHLWRVVQSVCSLCEKACFHPDAGIFGLGVARIKECEIGLEAHPVEPHSALCLLARAPDLSSHMQRESEAFVGLFRQRLSRTYRPLWYSSIMLAGLAVGLQFYHGICLNILFELVMPVEPRNNGRHRH